MKYIEMTLKEKNEIIDWMVAKLKDEIFDYFICNMFGAFFKDCCIMDKQIMMMFPELMITINNVREKQAKADNRDFLFSALHYKWEYRYTNRIRLLLNVKRRINK